MQIKIYIIIIIGNNIFSMKIIKLVYNDIENQKLVRYVYIIKSYIVLSC